MSSPGKKIFGNSGPLTADEMERYLQGNMSAEEMNAVEQKMMDDELSEEAMEGYESNPVALAELGVMAATFKASIGASAKGGFFAGVAGKMIASGVIVAGATVAVTVAVMDDEAPYEEPAPQEIALVEEEEAPQEEITFEELDAAIPIEEEEQITFEKTVEAQPILVPQGLDEEEVIEFIELWEEEVSEVAPQELPESEIEDPETIDPPYSNRAIAIINHLKVIDYSQYFTDIEQNQIVNSSEIDEDFLEAQFETFEQRDNYEPEIITTYIPYLEYLEVALAKFEAGEYSEAIKDLETIRKQYPEDMNAHFYGGLCYFNLNKKSKAIDYFQTVQANPANTFDQEAQYYEGLTWMKKGNDEKAIAVFEVIVALNDFYKADAEELLKSLRE